MDNNIDLTSVIVAAIVGFVVVNMGWGLLFIFTFKALISEPEIAKPHKVAVSSPSAR